VIGQIKGLGLGLDQHFALIEADAGQHQGVAVLLQAGQELAVGLEAGMAMADPLGHARQGQGEGANIIIGHGHGRSSPQATIVAG